MQQLPLIVSIVALLVSVCSFIVAVFAYRRDSSKIRAWSTLVWHAEGPDTHVPVMHIRVANVGRRPIYILNLVMRAGRSRWSQPLQQLAVEVSARADPVKYIEEVRRRSVAHVAALKLIEGDIYERIFRPEDCPDFINTHEDPMIKAQRLLVEDVTGICYPVTKSEKHLKQLFSAWRP
ncbi:MAG TPA: hypothetical protein VGD45_11740 [Steroidobacter sp.]|uniref:hypothetical protein n=1 Tax=Steroidobacter sp. TaxID=1978227 RepID=UPI002ED93121